MDNSSGLEILNAELYNDGPYLSPRQIQTPKNILPFGIINHSRSGLDPTFPEPHTDTENIQDTDDYGSRPRQKKLRTEFETLDDELVQRKARGRPMVITKDETAADVSVSKFLIFRTASKILWLSVFRCNIS